MRSRRCFISITRAKPGQWIPNVFGGRENLDAIYFLKRFNEVCYERFPGIMTIAEESTAWPGVSRPTYLGGLGFGFKWNMGWMHDFLEYMALDPIFRRFHHNNITFSLLYAFTGAFHSRVEPRRSRARQTLAHCRRCRATNGRSSPICGCFTRGCTGIPARSCFSWAASSASGANGTTTPSSIGTCSICRKHDGLRRLVQHLNYVYKNEPALWQQDDTYDGFEWIDFHDADNSVVSFMRKSREGERDRLRRERDADGASRLSARRSARRILSRDHQHRRRNLRRQQRRQSRRREKRGRAMDGPRTLDPDPAAAAGDGGVQAGRIIFTKGSKGNKGQYFVAFASFCNISANWRSRPSRTRAIDFDPASAAGDASIQAGTKCVIVESCCGTRRCKRGTLRYTRRWPSCSRPYDHSSNLRYACRRLVRPNSAAGTRSCPRPGMP